MSSSKSHGLTNIFCLSKFNHIYYIYILRGIDDSLYIGVTNNLELRVTQHNEGSDPKAYTYSRRPLELVYSESFVSIVKAINREKQLKKWSRIKKEALINGDLDKLKEKSKKKFE